LRTSDNINYRYDVIKVLKNLRQKEKTSGNHRADYCMHDFVAALNFDANILRFFENPKNNKDIGKKNEVNVNVSVKTAPEVLVSKVTVNVEVKDNQQNLPMAENAEYYEKNLMDAIARAQGKEKSFEDLRIEDIRNCLLSLPKNIAQGSVLMPRTANGTTFQGSDIHYLFSHMVSSPQWKGCPVFVSASVMQDYCLSANSNAACAYSSTIGEPVYNLMDTNMSPLLKEEVLAVVQNDAKAVPAEVVSQILYFAGSRKDLSIEQVQDVEKAWSAYRPLKMEDKVGKPLEDILYAARKKVEKRIDPKGLLRKYAFPENKIIELIDKGESEVKAKILVRPSTGISEDKYRDVHLRLRIIGGLVRVCTPGRNVVGSSLQEALKNSPLDAAALSRIDRFILQTQQNKDKKNGIKPPH